jgi:hypothetical protein
MSSKRFGPRRVSLPLLCIIASVVTLGTALNAIADNNVVEHKNRQTVRSTIDKSGNTFTCFGRNTVDPGFSISSVVVSTVCQYKSGGNWHDFERPPSNGESVVRIAEETYTDNPCTGTDGGANLGNGLYPIRGQADGYYTIGDAKYPFGNPVHTTNPFYQANC